MKQEPVYFFINYYLIAKREGSVVYAASGKRPGRVHSWKKLKQYNDLSRSTPEMSFEQFIAMILETYPNGHTAINFLMKEI